MGEYSLKMTVPLEGKTKEAQVDFMYFFDPNSQLSIEVDKILINGIDMYLNMPPRDIANIANHISETFDDWYDGASE